MARTTTKKGWSYSTGERRRNRVRAFEHPSGMLMLEFSDRGKRTRISLGHRDREQAKRQADAAASKLGNAEDLKPEESCVGPLFEMYLGEMPQTKSAPEQKYNRAAARMFKSYFGSHRPVLTLSLREWSRFIQDRREGRIGPGDGPWSAVSDRTIERDLRFLLAVLNWATMAGNGRGSMLLERNPFKGYPTPKEKNPLRVVLTEEEYAELLKVAKKVDWRFHVALVLAYETGHRIGSIRQLQWSDVDLDGQKIRWRAQTEKNGYEHVTPMTEAAREALGQARNRNPGIGDAPVLPAPKDGSQSVSKSLARDWWSKAVRLAELEPKRGRGWHSFRRKFASDHKHTPLKTLCELGGWKSHVTVLTCYQHADERDMRAALANRRSGYNRHNESTQAVDEGAKITPPKVVTSSGATFS